MPEDKTIALVTDGPTIALTPAERKLLDDHRAKTAAAVSKIDPSMTRTCRALLEAGIEVASAVAKPKPLITVRCRANHAQHMASAMAVVVNLPSLSRVGEPGPSLSSTVDYAEPNTAIVRLEGVDDAVAFPEPKPAA